MRISLNIQDGKAAAFLNFIKTLDYIQVEGDNVNEIELTEDLKKALDESIDSLKNEGGISNKQVMTETRKKFPNLFK